MRYGKRDDNHKDIVACFRGYGASVSDVSSLPNIGYDIVVGFRGFNFLVEIKDGKKAPSARKLTKSEQNMLDTWNGQYSVVESEEDVYKLLFEEQ